jgi:hypothetical protein
MRVSMLRWLTVSEMEGEWDEEKKSFRNKHTKIFKETKLKKKDMY